MTEKNDKKRVEKMPMWEEPDAYLVIANKAKNRLEISFKWKLKKAEDAPMIVEHVRLAMEELEEGPTVLANGTEMKGYPGFQLTRPFAAAQKHIMAKKPGRMAAVTGLVGVKVATNVMSKFSGMKSKFFKTLEEAEEWLDKKE